MRESNDAVMDNDRNNDVHGTDEEDIIQRIAGKTMKKALSQVPEAATITKSTRVEDRIEEYVNISDVYGAKVGGEYGYDWISDTMLSGYEETTADGVKTRVSWIRNACMCLDYNCSNTTAVDLNGAWNEGYTELRGRGPILLFDGDRDSPAPCLGARKYPMDEVTVEGCTPRQISVREERVWDNYVRTIVLEKCEAAPLDSLEIFDSKGRFIGRALKGSEVMPMSTLRVKGKATPPNFDKYNLSYYIDQHSGMSAPDRSFDLFDFSTWATWAEWTRFLAYSTIKSIFLTFLDVMAQAMTYDFDPERSSLLSNSPFEEILRVSDAVTETKFRNSLSDPTGNISNTLLGSPLYREIVMGIPETSPIQEIISGGVLLFLTACAVGYTLGKLREFKGRYQEDRSKAIKELVLPFIAALLAVVAEAIAYFLRWRAEVEQDTYTGAMTLVEVLGGGRFQGVAFLRTGRDHDTFIVTTFVVEVSDASESYAWVLILGAVVSLMAFVIAFLVGCTELSGAQRKVGDATL